MKKKKLIEMVPLKVAMFFVTVVTICFAAGSLLTGLVLANEGFYEYHSTEQTLEEEKLTSLAQDWGRQILWQWVYGDDKQEILDFCKDTNVKFEICVDNGQPVFWNAGKTQSTYSYHLFAAQEADYWTYLYVSGYQEAKRMEKDAEHIYEVKLYVDSEFPAYDSFRRTAEWVRFGFRIRYGLILWGVLAAALGITGFVFLMMSAGHKYEEEPNPKKGCVPLDFMTIVTVCGVATVVAGSEELIRNLSFKGGRFWGGVILILLLVMAGLALLLGYCMICAAQFKSGMWWKRTILCRIGTALARFVKWMVHGIGTVIRNLPILWKCLLLLAAVVFGEILLVLLVGGSEQGFAIIWFLEKLLLLAAVPYFALVFHRLQEGSRRLAAGELNYQVSTQQLFGECKEHAQNLNSIAMGMNHAVEERMKSERLKTELITNVSHDIKTPLTSIINYAELIGREPSENPRIQEYGEVLLRQSARLKKLIEDLVEASKASTGNIEVQKAPCEVGVLLSQAVGEYTKRFEEKKLEWIVKQPEEPIVIIADGRLLWRVFDNLLNNIYKYAQSNTRVYLVVEEKESIVQITFKNISACRLDISADELMERFVRGDDSRNTEGSGLGLSIAQSLTKLMEGRMELIVDGDLFKVILEFSISESRL